MNLENENDIDPSVCRCLCSCLELTSFDKALGDKYVMTYMQIELVSS